MSTDVRNDPAATRLLAKRRVRNVPITAAGLRMLHSYISAFIAPMIVFFALSGSAQILGLHEAHGDYKPSAFMSSIGRLHKSQVFAPAATRPKLPPRLVSDIGREGPKPQTSLATQLLKGLFVAEALALVATTLFGVWIGITHAKRARAFWIVLGAGTVLPLLLIAL